VILDEIHAIAADKRGTHLIAAVDRLVLLSGEFQRLALSATVKPVDRIAAWVGGYRLVREPGTPAGEGETARGDPVYQKREVAILQSTSCKQLELGVGSTGLQCESKHVASRPDPTAPIPTSAREAFWNKLVADIKSRIRANRSTLQSIGRAGHGVGEVSRGWLYCTHGRDLLNAALMARSIAEQDIKEIHLIEAPLDLLTQIILSMTAVRAWQADELYDTLRANSPYHNLSRKHYDLVLQR